MREFKRTPTAVKSHEQDGAHNAKATHVLARDALRVYYVPQDVILAAYFLQEGPLFAAISNPLKSHMIGLGQLVVFTQL